MKFYPHRDTKEMLDAVGVKAVEELFTGLEPKLGRELDLPHPMSELDLSRHLKDVAGENRNMINFIGAGAYDHYIPSAVNHIILRSEFYTAYTPYQAEISQGTLQAIYEFQTYICRLTGMDAANASMYDGATALAEAVFMAKDITGRENVVISNDIHPQHRQVLETYCAAHSLKLNSTKDINDKTACVIVQNPDFFGSVHGISNLAGKARSAGALFIVSVLEPTSLAIIEPPGMHGADIVVGEGQSFGNPISFGGPLLGFLAVKREHLKRIPGRLSGMTADSTGRRGFILTLQAREQHIRRERAGSNICSNQALCALAATVYLSLMGKTGLRKVALKSFENAHELQKRMEAMGYRLVNDMPFYNEFTVECPIPPATIIKHLAGKGICAGLDAGSNRLIVCCTEKSTAKNIDDYIHALESIKSDKTREGQESGGDMK